MLTFSSQERKGWFWTYVASFLLASTIKFVLAHIQTIPTIFWNLLWWALMGAHSCHNARLVDKHCQGPLLSDRTTLLRVHHWLSAILALWQEWVPISAHRSRFQNIVGKVRMWVSINLIVDVKRKLATYVQNHPFLSWLENGNIHCTNYSHIHLHLICVVRWFDMDVRTEKYPLNWQHKNPADRLNQGHHWIGIACSYCTLSHKM